MRRIPHPHFSPSGLHRALVTPLAILGAVLLSGAAHTRPIAAMGDTPYPGNHAGSLNNDYVDRVAPVDVKKVWESLSDSMIVFPCASGPEGNVYCTTGWALEDDRCNLSAIDSKTGKILWQDRVDGKCMLNEHAHSNSPTVDVDGNVYMGDSRHMLSFSPDGKLRWKNDIHSRLASRKGLPNPPFGIIVLPDGNLATVTMGDGWALIFDRETGELQAEPFDLPADKRPEWDQNIGEGEPVMDAFNSPNRPDGFLERHMSKAGADLFWAWALGESEYETDNAIAVDPTSGLIFVSSGAPAPNKQNKGALWALRREGREISVAFHVTVDADGGIATTPSVSDDGQFVVIGDGNANMVVIDLPACRKLPAGSRCDRYEAIPVGLDILNSVAISPENRVILPEGNQHLQAIDLGRDENGKIVAKQAWRTQIAETKKGNSVITAFKNVAYAPIYYPIEGYSEIVAISMQDGSILGRHRSNDAANITMAADGTTLITNNIVVHEVVSGKPGTAGVWGWRPE